MANDFTTTVSYDVTPAVTELERLDNKVEESAQTATKSFKVTGAASQLITKGMGQAGATVQAFASNAGLAVKVASSLGVSASVVAVAGAAIVAQWVDLPGIFANTAKQLDLMSDALDRNLELQDSASRITDNFENSQSSEFIERLRLRQAEIQDEQAAISAQREGFRDRLSAAKTYYRQLDQAARDSARERESLEDSVARLIEKRFLSSIEKLPAGQQVNKLIEEATAQRDAGDFDAAERLLDKALDAAKESGNAFNQRRVGDEQDALVKSMLAEVAAQEQREAAIRKAQATIAAETKAIENKSKALEKQNNELARERKTVGAEAKRETIAAGDRRDQQGADEAARAFETNARKIDLVARSSRSGLEQLTGQLGTYARAFVDFGGRFEDALSNTDRVQQIARDLIARNRERQQSGGITPADVLADAPDVQELDRLVAALRTTPGGVPGTIEKEVANLERLLELLKERQRIAGDFTGANRSIEQPIQEGAKEAELLDRSTQNTSGELGKAALEADKLEKSLGKAAQHQIRGPRFDANLQPINPSIPAPSSAGQAAAQGPRQVQQTVNANINIRGGMLDPETMQQISERVAREIRKGTVA